MKVRDAIRNFLRLLIEFLYREDMISTVDDLEAILEYDSIENIIQNIKENLNQEMPNVLETVFEIIEDQNEEILEKDAEELCRIINIQIINDTESFKEKIRHFSFADTKGAVISKSFFENMDIFRKIISNNIDFDILKNNAFELILYLGKNDDQDELNRFLNFLFGVSKINSFVLIKKDYALEDEELYSFLYMYYLAKGYRTRLHSNMIYIYQLDPDIEEEIQSLSDFKLSQFFEIFDVFDEYQHATDILLRFLKLYQIIEYLLIRVLLVRIQQRTGRHKQFIRELMGIKKYNDFDKKLFRELFENEKNDLVNWFKNLATDSSIKDEIEKYLSKPIDINQNSDKYWLNLLADLLYQLRNSIVHNKESEYHITIHTTTPRTANLLREILSKFEKIILEKLIKYDRKISYNCRELILY